MSETFKVIIRPDAYIRMITHVLKFGNEALEEDAEVMGVCVGQIDETEKNIDLINIIPIQHGMHVSTGFTKEDVELISQLEKESEEGNKIVGWYISRPGWGIDFTDITIQNHKFFQTEKNPQAFIIVFDHSMMGNKDEDFGFKIYTLIDHKKSNDFSEVTYEVETPASLNYFKWVKKFIEDSQRPDPVLIRELKEQTARELQEIPIAEENFIEERIKDHSTQIIHVIDGFRNGLSQLNEIVSEPYNVQLQNWINEMTQGTLKGSEYIGNSLNQLKNTVSDGLKDVQKFINNTFIEISGLFKNNITEYINKRVEGQVELKNDISAILDETISASLEKIKIKIKNSIDPLDENIQNLLTTMEDSVLLNSKLANQTINLNQLVSESENNAKILKDELGTHIEQVATPFNNQIVESFEAFDSELNPIKESYSEIQILLEKLQKIITEFKNLV
ncbi:MAG: hypothetical protein ACXABO_09315 [Promethearchaeota archaeon]|jgi:hypothetical protein